MQGTKHRYSASEKGLQVTRMFDNIAPRYDFLNHFLTAGLDRLWRRKAIRMLADSAPQSLLDIATGTADFAIAACVLKPREVVGVDVSQKMLEIARQKVGKAGLNHLISLVEADASALPFNSNAFDAVTIGFGIRNFGHIEQSLAEIFRVLRPGGKLVILELSWPRKRAARQLMRLYLRRIVPTLGGMVSEKAAYSYLSDSVDIFTKDVNLLQLLDDQGYIGVKRIPLTLDLVSIHLASKPHTPITNALGTEFDKSNN